MWRRVRKIAFIFLLAYLGVVVIVAALESYLMYPAPGTQNAEWNPEWLGHEEVFIPTAAGNQIHAWFCEHPSAKRAILFCHGNGEHLPSLPRELEYLRDKFQASILAFDYRGYGKSEGKPFEAGILIDGEAAQQWLSERTKLPPSEIILWGRSLGGAVAVHLAAKNGAKALVLDRTFSSMVDVAATHYPWLPVRLLLTNRYPSEKRIKNYSGPLIQIHGIPDEIVPFKYARRLHEAAPGTQKQFIESDNLTHNDPWQPDFYDRVSQFLDALNVQQ